MAAEPLKRWVLTALAGAQQDQATELVMSPLPDDGTALRYKIGDVWHEHSPSPGIHWSQVRSELAGLAGIREIPFPKEGMIHLAYSGARLRWQVSMPGPDRACVLRWLGGEMI